ncbi:hypothetical protein D3C76_1824790 [compost metagenome]
MTAGANRDGKLGFVPPLVSVDILRAGPVSDPGRRKTIFETAEDQLPVIVGDIGNLKVI